MMTFTRFFIPVILGLMLLVKPAWSQNDLDSATNALQDVLSTVKQSVEQLSLDNDQLTTKDNALKQQVSQLQLQLGSLQQQEQDLDNSQSALQANNPSRAQKIADLEGENNDLDNRAQKAQESIRLIQQSLDVANKENLGLLLQMQKMQGLEPDVSSGAVEVSQAEDHRQKEKLKLMKMIYDSQLKQESLHQAIMDYQKNSPLAPAASAMAHQQYLKEQIKDLEDQLSAYPQEKVPQENAGTYQWDDSQFKQLEMELKVLEENYSQLKTLMEQMDKKAKVTRMTTSQKVEEGKLQDSLIDLNRQGAGLRADLDDLRSQMVDLDKRKTRLDMLIRQSP